MTTDVLEHVPEPLLPTVVAEFTRVAVEALFMAISVVAERVKFGNATLHETVRKARGGRPPLRLRTIGAAGTPSVSILVALRAPLERDCVGSM